MAVNSFIAALGNILEGASSDRERTRKLKELEEEREYRKQLQKQDAEDRKNKLAMDKFLFRQDLANMGATEGKSPDDLTGQLDSYLPPKKDITTTDLGMGGPLDKQSYRPSLGLSSEPALKGITLSSKNIGKFTGGGPVLGASPFEGKDAMDAIDRATKRGNVQTEMDETFELPDGTRMRIPSLLSRQAAARQVAGTEAEAAARVQRERQLGYDVEDNAKKNKKAYSTFKSAYPSYAAMKQPYDENTDYAALLDIYENQMQRANTQSGADKAAAMLERARVAAIDTELRSALSANAVMLGREPRQSDFVEGELRQPDKPAFAKRMMNWRADSTEVAGRLTKAQADKHTLDAELAVSEILKNTTFTAKQREAQIAKVAKRLDEQINGKAKPTAGAGGSELWKNIFPGYQPGAK